MSVSVWHCGSKIVENRGVTTDEAGDKKLDAKVALKSCPFCGQMHVDRAADRPCPFEGAM
jgi:hypothetical protein